MNISDIEKSNIQHANLDYCYDNIKNTTLSRYTLDTEVIPNKNINDRTILGWISDDIKQILPKAVSSLDFNITKKILEPKNDSSDKFINVNIINYDQIYAMMYGAIQKLIQDKEALEKTVYEQFASMIASQQTQITALHETVSLLQDQISVLHTTGANTPIHSPHDTVTSLQHTVATLQQTLAIVLAKLA